MTKKAAPRKSSSKKIDRNMPASKVIEKLGGLQVFCNESAKFRENKKPYPTSTVWSWIEKGVIPIGHIPVVKQVAKSLKIKLSDSEFMPSEPV